MIIYVRLEGERTVEPRKGSHIETRKEYEVIVYSSSVSCIDAKEKKKIEQAKWDTNGVYTTFNFINQHTGQQFVYMQ